jgi:hypothetical protein
MVPLRPRPNVQAGIAGYYSRKRFLPYYLRERVYSPIPSPLPCMLTGIAHKKSGSGEPLLQRFLLHAYCFTSFRVRFSPLCHTLTK